MVLGIFLSVVADICSPNVTDLHVRFKRSRLKFYLLDSNGSKLFMTTIDNPRPGGTLPPKSFT